MRLLLASLALALSLTIGPRAATEQPPARGSAQGPETPAPATARPAPPTIDDLVSLKRVASPVISPDGRFVAFTVRETNWEDNAYETEIWLADVESGLTRQLTHGKKSSNQPTWAPDGSRLAFASDRTDKRQIYLIHPRGGEADLLTSAEEGVTLFAWSPDGAQIAYTATDPKPDAIKDRDKRYGEFEIIDRDHRMAQLYLIDVVTKKSRKLTDGRFVVGAFDWSPDGSRIAFVHRINSDPTNSGTADISIVEVRSGKIQPLVSEDGPDTNPVWSPDGSRLAFVTSRGRPSYMNDVIATIPGSGGATEVLSVDFDEEPSVVDWTRGGIFFSASERTGAYLYHLDPRSKAVTRLAPAERWVGTEFSLLTKPTGAAATGDKVAFVGAGAESFPEVYVAPLLAPATPGAKPAEGPHVKKLTDLGAQVAGWPAIRREVIAWASQDGASIEGVLHQPARLEPGRKYPLLVVIHGGPTGVSRPIPYASASYYPIDLWVNRGALVLDPNYRGSAGYGEKFRSLNVRNLGIGDAWDVLSGIEHLVAKGLADRDRIGTMGWSQGGYISAFLGTRYGDRFKAVSVGAGISDWMTYYVNTDIHQFTRSYLQATPWDDPDIYAKTSPITYLRSARAPTLIQHGELDLRVPIPNAYELYQGLQDHKVPVKLVVYKGFGHGLNKPKANRAAMEHNLEWFNQHIWGDPAPIVVTPQIGR